MIHYLSEVGEIRQPCRQPNPLKLKRRAENLLVFRKSSGYGRGALWDALENQNHQLDGLQAHALIPRAATANQRDQVRRVSELTLSRACPVSPWKSKNCPWENKKTHTCGSDRFPLKTNGRRKAEAASSFVQGASSEIRASTAIGTLSVRDF